jgi:cholesterol transport system auxiliary component
VIGARSVKLLVLAAAALLSGCVSLLPQQPPVQLYQFGQGATPAEASAGDAPSGPAPVGRGQGDLGVVLAQVSLPRASLGDGILTLHGAEAGYIAGGRWLAPAVELFQDAAERDLRTRAGRVRLVGRGDLAAASALLRLDVDEFDARYGPDGGPPTVVVSLHASLVRADGRVLVQKAVLARRPAGENRVAAIVAAYDAAVAEVLGETAKWVQAETPILAASLDPASPTVLPPRHPLRHLPPAAAESGTP